MSEQSERELLRVGGLGVTRMLILDGPHTGHVAYLEDDMWTCSCGQAVLSLA